MIDDESEQAVERWVRLGDRATGRPEPDERATCARCGSTHHVLDRGAQALCAHCYLEGGGPGEAAESDAAAALVEGGDDRGT